MEEVLAKDPNYEFLYDGLHVSKIISSIRLNFTKLFIFHITAKSM